MRITLIQDTIIWADKKANLQKTIAQLETLAGKTDLAVLPEMFSTGFCTSHTELAETMDGETITTLRQAAINYQLAVTGSFIATENGRAYNRAFFIYPDGKIKTCDKRHLFSIGDEGKLFTAGKERLILPYKDFNICLLVCYDLRFPVWSRNVNNEYDLLIYVGNWPTSRIHVWNVLLEARAIENQTYVCGVNRIGEDGMGITYNGSSKLINPKGEKLFTAALNEAQIETLSLSKEELTEFRNKFPVWKDADNFKIM